MFSPLEDLRALFRPGGLYNLGNAVGFESGLAVALLGPIEGAGGDRSWLQLVIAYLAGSPATLALSLATVIFYWGGIVYDQAWACGAPPDASLTRRGDILSGVGAVTLAAGLVMVGNPWLALFAGGMHAGGKFGSAFAGARQVKLLGGQIGLQDFCKDVVLLSRVPAILAATFGYAVHGELAIPIVGSLIACYLIWGAADIMLLSPGGFIFGTVARLRGVAGTSP